MLKTDAMFSGQQRIPQLIGDTPGPMSCLFLASLGAGGALARRTRCRRVPQRDKVRQLRAYEGLPRKCFQSNRAREQADVFGAVRVALRLRAKQADCEARP